MSKRLVSFDDQATGTGLPAPVEAALNATYGRVRTINGQEPDGDGNVQVQGGTPGAVVGAGVTRMVASTDPNYPLADGELLVLVKAPIFFTDFSTLTVDQAPPGWTQPWVQDSTWKVVADAAATGGKVLRSSPATAGRAALKWEAASAANAADCEIVYRWRASTSSAQPRAFMRGSGAAASETGYWVGRNAAQVSIGRLNAGTNTTIKGQSMTINSNEWYRTRARIQGNVLSMRSWADAEPEPTTWAHSAADTTPITAAGWVGVLNSGAVQADYDWVGVAYGGATAPMQAVA